MPTLSVTSRERGQRLDSWLAERVQDLSRARWQRLIREGYVTVNGSPHKPHYPLHEGEIVKYEIPPVQPLELQPESMPLEVLFEDSDLIAVNKPAGLVVHPAAGHDSGTLVNALLHHCKDLAGVGGTLRPGIVHRLDKDSSGVLIAAKNDETLQGLAQQFKQRRVQKEYLALVWGHPEPESGTIDTLVGRSATDRKKMSARPPRGRRAVTHYESIERLPDTALLRVVIETGRTHQIRVHLAHRGHPIVGDRQYGRTRKRALPHVPTRQMLHAHKLALRHPQRAITLELVAPLPRDMQDVIRALRAAAPTA